MTAEQREKYEKLSKKEKEYKEFLEQVENPESEVAMTRYSSFGINRLCYIVRDEEFKKRVAALAKEMLADVQREIDMI